MRSTATLPGSPVDGPTGGTGVPIALLVGYVGGVLLADAGFDAGFIAGFIATGEGGSRAAGGGAGRPGIVVPLCLATFVFLLDRGRPARQRDIAKPVGGLCTAMGWLLAASIALLAGHARLGDRLEAARADRIRGLEQAGRTLIVEARVRERHRQPWGDRVRLIALRAVDGRDDALPRALELMLDPPAAPNAADREPRVARSGAANAGPSVARSGAANAGPSVARSGAANAGPSVARSRADALLRPGARVRLALRIRARAGWRNPGNPDPERQAARRGIGAVARLVDPGWVVAIRERPGRLGNRSPFSAWRAAAAQVRSVWRARAIACLEDAGAAPALVPALALGDRERLATSTREAFRALGLSHLMAISGLHVGFVAALVASVLLLGGSVARARSRVRRWPFDWALAAGCGAALVYGWLVEAPISVQRATLAFALYAAPRSSRRIPEAGTVLAWVGLVLAVADPAVVFDPGAQLSFAACIGIVVVLDRRRADPSARERSVRARRVWLGRRSSAATAPLFEGLRVSTAAALATAPFVLAGGGSVAVGAPIANALAVPFTGLLVLPGALAAVVGAGALPPAWLRVLVWPAATLEAVVVSVADLVSAETLELPGVLPLALLVGLVALGLVALRRGRSSVAILCWLLVTLLGAAPEPRWTQAPSPPRAVFFDVGQGDALLLEAASSRILVDSGGGPPDGTGGRGLIRALRALGVSRLDALVITHADLDHRGGARRILQRLVVAELALPAGRERDPPLVALAEAAQRRGMRVRWLRAGDRLVADTDLTVDVIWPQLPVPVRLTRNDTSLVLGVELAGRRLLLMADAGEVVERHLLQAGRIQNVDLLKLGHHGSRSSSGPSLLRRASPRFVLLSAPCPTSRGLPSAAVLERVERLPARLLWTGRDGAWIYAPRPGEEADVEHWAKPRICHLPITGDDARDG